MNNRIYVLCGLLFLLYFNNASAQHPVYWKNKAGVISDANGLTKNTIDGWANAGASSVNILDNLLGTSWVEYKITQTSSQFSFGLSAQDLNLDYKSIDYGFIFQSNGQFNIVEKGNNKISNTAYNIGDVFRIERTAISIVYKKNGTTLRTSLILVPITSQVVDLTIFGNGNSVGAFSCSNPNPKPLSANAGRDTTIEKGDSIIIGAMPSAEGGYPPYTYSWSPTSGLNSSSIANPIAKPAYSVSYILSVMDSKAALKKDTIIVNVKPKKLGFSFTSFPDKSRDTSIVDTLSKSQLGKLDLSLKGGKPPYSIIWNTGETSTNLIGKMGKYSIQVIDSTLDTLRSSLYIGTPVQWAYNDGLTVSPTSVTKTSNAGWNVGGIISKNVVASNQSGIIQFTIPNKAGDAIVGFKNYIQKTFSSYTDFSYAIRLNSGLIQIVENGSIMGSFGNYGGDDIFRIERAGNAITYFKNDNIIRSLTDPDQTQILTVAVKINTINTAINGPIVLPSAAPTIYVNSITSVDCSKKQLGAIDIGVSGGSGVYAYVWSNGASSEDISDLQVGTYTVSVYEYPNLSPVAVKAIDIGYIPSWINIIGINIDKPTGTLTKNVAAGWGNSGVSSDNTLPAGIDGWAEFTATSGDIDFMYGFSYTDINQGYTSIVHGIRLYQPVISGKKVNTIEFYSNGTKLSPTPASGSTFTYLSGDIIRVKRQASNLLYYKNGKLLTTIAIADANKDYIIDVAINNANTAIKNIQASFSCSQVTQYATLSEKLSGSYYTVKNNMLYFKYDEKYQNGPLSYKIYDWKHEAKTSSVVLNKIRGANWFAIDITAVSGVSVGEYYVIETTNDKGLIEMLRFKVE